MVRSVYCVTLPKLTHIPPRLCVRCTRLSATIPTRSHALAQMLECLVRELASTPTQACQNLKATSEPGRSLNSVNLDRRLNVVPWTFLICLLSMVLHPVHRFDVVPRHASPCFAPRPRSAPRECELRSLAMAISPITSHVTPSPCAHPTHHTLWYFVAGHPSHQCCAPTTAPRQQHPLNMCSPLWHFAEFALTPCGCVVPLTPCVLFVLFNICYSRTIYHFRRIGKHCRGCRACTSPVDWSLHPPRNACVAL
jgi:hypothetical protein